MEFPTALLGVALGTILLPSLAQHHSDADHEEYSALLDWGLRLAILLALPAALALALLALPLVSTLYQYGKFTVDDVMQTRAALLGYSVGLPALILVKILAPGFYARQMMNTPVKIAFVHRARHADARRHPRMAARPRAGGPHARDEHRRLLQCGPAAVAAVAQGPLPPAPRLARLFREGVRRERSARARHRVARRRRHGVAARGRHASRSDGWTRHRLCGARVLRRRCSRSASGSPTSTAAKRRTPLRQVRPTCPNDAKREKCRARAAFAPGGAPGRRPQHGAQFGAVLAMRAPRLRAVGVQVERVLADLEAALLARPASAASRSRRRRTPRRARIACRRDGRGACPRSARTPPCRIRSDGARAGPACSNCVSTR